MAMKISTVVIYGIILVLITTNLSMIVLFTSDIPKEDDYDGITLAYSIHKNNTISITDFFEPHSRHIPAVVRAIIVPLLISDNFNFLFINIVQFFIVIASFVLVIALVKKSNISRWILVPISLLIFNSLQQYTFLWTFGGLQQTIPFISIIGMIYLLKRKSWLTILLSQICVFAMMFSNSAGLLIWPVGILSFIGNKSKRIHFIVWLLMSITLTIIFLSLSLGFIETQSNIIQKNTSIQQTILYFLSLLSLPFRLLESTLHFLYGAVTLSLSIFLITYSFKKRNDSKIPWIQMCFSGLIFMTITTLAQAAGWNGNPVKTAEWYITLISLFHIGLVGLIFINLVELTKIKPHLKKYFLAGVMIYCFILVTIVIPSYYVGWKNAVGVYAESEILAKCLIVETFHSLCTIERLGSIHYNYGGERILEYMQDNNMNIFSNRS